VWPFRREESRTARRHNGDCRRADSRANLFGKTARNGQRWFSLRSARRRNGRPRLRARRRT
jgi:hypothetical protein